MVEGPIRLALIMLLPALFLAYAQHPQLITNPYPIDSPSNKPYLLPSPNPQHYPPPPEVNTPRRFYPMAVKIPIERIRKMPYFRKARIVRKFRGELKRKIAAMKERLRAWHRYRTMFYTKKISEREYLARTKEMVSSLIDTMVERLKSIEEDNEPVLIELVNRLEELKNKVREVNDLYRLRELYRVEVRPLLLKARYFFRYYYLGLVLDVFQKFTERMEAYAQRLPEERRQKIMSELNNIKMGIDLLRKELEQGGITVDSAYRKLRVLRERLAEVIRRVRGE